MATLDAVETPLITDRLLAHGDGWRVVEVTCRAGPQDRPFEEQHGWTSIAAVLGGSFTYRSRQGRRALMAPGSLLLGNAGTCFECGHEHGTGDRCVAFQFAPSLADEGAGSLEGVTRADFAHASVPPLDRLLPLLSEAQALTDAPDILRAEQLALRFAATALRLDQDREEAASNTAWDDARAARAVRLIEARYAEPLMLADLARAAGVTRGRLIAVFRRAVGMTPYRYILNRRLAAAADQLRRTSAPVLQVALDVGFGDLSEFTRRFRDRYGHPPARYRRIFRTAALPRKRTGPGR